MALCEGDDQLKIRFHETLSARFSHLVVSSHMFDTGDLLRSVQRRNPGQLRQVSFQRITAKCCVVGVAHLLRSLHGMLTVEIQRFWTSSRPERLLPEVP